jgi:SAM-dependent methyltransferase
MLAEVRARTPRLQRLTRRGPRLVNADVRALPLASGTLGLAWSNLMLHWLDDPLPAFRELHRVLEVGGLLCFSHARPGHAEGAARRRRRSRRRRYGESASSTCTTWATCWSPPASAIR